MRFKLTNEEGEMTAHFRTNHFQTFVAHIAMCLLFAGAMQLLEANSASAQPPVRFEAFGPVRTPTSKENVQPPLEMKPPAPLPEQEGVMAEIQAIRNRLGIDPLKGTTLEHIEIGEDAGFNAALKIISNSTPRQPTQATEKTRPPSIPLQVSQPNDWRTELRQQARDLEHTANRVEDHGEPTRADRLRKLARRLRKEAASSN